MHYNLLHIRKCKNIERILLMIIIAKPTGFHFDQLAFANSTSSTGIPLTADICRNKENDRFTAKSMA